MRTTRLMMGMPITIDVAGVDDGGIIEEVFTYFDGVDRRFSTYKSDSEISAINQARLAEADYSAEMREVLDIAAETKRATGGYFDIRMPDGTIDPSGIVKGWSIRNAAMIIAASGARDYFVDAGGDIQSSGHNETGEDWSVGIRSPFNPTEIIKVVYPHGHGVATSGSYVRGQHINNPHAPGRSLTEIVSLTVIGPDILEADRFATAAFAMGRNGILFVEDMPGLEGYAVARDGIATMTSGLGAYFAP